MKVIARASAILPAIVLLCAGATLAPEVRQARDLYYQGIYGEKDATEKADEEFSKLYKQKPNDPFVEVYYGSLRLIEAQHTWALWKKNALSKQGIQLMDKAVEQEKADLEIRFVRAATERNLPSFFGRKDQVASDLAFLTERAPDAVKKGEFEPRLAAATFFYYGELCREQSKLTEAEQAWKTAVNIAPDSNGGRKSRAELEKNQRGG